MNVNLVKINEFSADKTDVFDEFVSSFNNLSRLAVWQQINVKVIDLLLNVCLSKKINVNYESHLEGNGKSFCKIFKKNLLIISFLFLRNFNRNSKINRIEQ